MFLDPGEDSTLTFDIRYDNECNYDYAYLEYLDSGTGAWTLMPDSAMVWPASASRARIAKR